MSKKKQNINTYFATNITLLQLKTCQISYSYMRTINRWCLNFQKCSINAMLVLFATKWFICLLWRNMYFEIQWSCVSPLWYVFVLTNIGLNHNLRATPFRQAMTFWCFFYYSWLYSIPDKDHKKCLFSNFIFINNILLSFDVS